jgi:hypothetical protein
MSAAINKLMREKIMILLMVSNINKLMREKIMILLMVSNINKLIAESLVFPLTAIMTRGMIIITIPIITKRSSILITIIEASVISVP